MTTLTRYAFRTELRKGAVGALKAYAQTANLKLSVFDARPVSITPPHAFIDRFSDEIHSVGANRRQRSPTCQIVVIHGRYDFPDTAVAADAFVDGFLDYILENPHLGGANTEVEIVAVSDEPNYVPDWQPPDRQFRYYASLFALKGLAFD